MNRSRTKRPHPARRLPAAFVLVWLLVPASCSRAEEPAKASPPPATKTKSAARSGSPVTGRLPGAPAVPDELMKALEAKRKERGPGYEPRTRHLYEDGWARYSNRLFLQSSPYLLQHAHNPVDWYPWGDEAFAVARERGVPVLLSVGYSTCHWCHVMEEESFEDEEIAAYMNANYVAIKVDREERPDVDGIYMAAVQALTGRGGWPMTVWLTPDRKPFYGGTYFPARDGDRGSGTGFLTLLRRLKQAYDEEPDKIAESSASLAQTLQSRLGTTSSSADLPGASVMQSAASAYKSRFDRQNGGMRGAPKFPSSFPVRFLLRYHRRTGDAEVLEMASITLDKMARGGMYDQAGGGFHRYATDQRWLVPHFEKMLYDNALLTMAYLEGYQVTGNADFARTAREILRYVDRDMTSPVGAFYSATDADSLTPSGHREEGYFFTWTIDELRAQLGDERSSAIAAYYGATARGNFEGRNILNVPRPLEAVARELEMNPDELWSMIQQAREELYEARKDRPAPLRDEKILTAWNGLMISAYAQAALVLGDEHYAETAAGAADFVLGKLRREGRLLRSYKDGKASHNAYLDDYAFLTAGLLDLYEATSEPRWLREAIALDEVLAEHYEDEKAGGFFMTSNDHEELLAREKPSYDGAEPSGNSVALLNLLRLQELTTNDHYRVRAERCLRTFGGGLSRSPTALSEMLLALDYQLDTPKEIIIVTPKKKTDAEPLLAELRSTFLPNRVLTVVAEGAGQDEIGKLVPLVKSKVTRRGQATAYVCENRVCELPTADPAVFAKQIQKVKPLDGASGR